MGLQITLVEKIEVKIKIERSDNMVEMWQNQIEALDFAMRHPSVMLNMDMGTGKTRVAIETAFARCDIKKVLVVCPKAVIPVWRNNLTKFVKDKCWACWDETKGTVPNKTKSLQSWVEDSNDKSNKQVEFIVVNYDIVWRSPIGPLLRKINFDMIILDESHRIKAAGSKVSKFLFLLGKPVKYKMCLSGTPMANSPLDIYGQYRFLDSTIFGTRFDVFRNEYAILEGPERNFIVGFKNLQQLNNKFQSIAYTCKMSNISDKLKLPEKLPPYILNGSLSPGDTRVIKQLRKEFIAECKDGFIVLENILNLLLREQQITSGFTVIKENPGDPETKVELNSVKKNLFINYLDMIPESEPVVVFYTFKHDAEVLRSVCDELNRMVFELSGSINELSAWQEYEFGGILLVQIQSGAEGVDMTKSRRAVYFNLPQSLALYEQSMARLYRPGQTEKVQFTYLILKDTIDEKIFECLTHKKSLIEDIQSGGIDLDYLK